MRIKLIPPNDHVCVPCHDRVLVPYRSRVVSFLSGAYGIALIILGIIFPLFEIGGSVTEAFAFEVSWILKLDTRSD